LTYRALSLEEKIYEKRKLRLIVSINYFISILTIGYNSISLQVFKKLMQKLNKKSDTLNFYPNYPNK